MHAGPRRRWLGRVAGLGRQVGAFVGGAELAILAVQEFGWLDVLQGGRPLVSLKLDQLGEAAARRR